MGGEDTLTMDDCFLNAAQQSYGYVDVRPNAHMFWWMFFSSHSAGYMNRPLVLWIQGGPGNSGSGLGVFEIIGPFDIHGNTREFTWIQEVNILFVDSPVGTGFSYVSSPDAFTTNVEQIAVDLTVFLKEFMTENPEFKTAPLYIMGQSYGGKMVAAASQKMQKEIESGALECNLKGLAMGNSFIHPGIIVMTYGPMLYSMSNVDEPGLERIQSAAQRVKSAIDAGRWQEAFKLSWANFGVIKNETNNIDLYNILQYDPPALLTKRAERNRRDDLVTFSGSSGSLNLEDFMNKQVREHLGIIPEDVIWQEFNVDVFNHHELEIMQDVLEIVDDILKTTDLQVVVFQGQLDLLCNTVGAMKWVHELTWDGLTGYIGAERKALVDPETKQTDSFVKAHKNFKFYWLLKSGHTAAADSKFAGLRMLKRIIDDEDH